MRYSFVGVSILPILFSISPAFAQAAKPAATPAPGIPAPAAAPAAAAPVSDASVTAPQAKTPAAAADTAPVADASATASTELPRAVPTPVPAPPVVVAPEAPPAPEAPSLFGFDKGFYLQSADGKFKFITGARMQARFSISDKQAATGATSTDAAFSLPRIRLHGKGHVFSENYTYRWQFELGQGFLALRDAYLNFKLLPWLNVRVGQDTKPFSREQLTSGFRQQLVDRSVVDTRMGNIGGGDGGTGRDVGILLHNGLEKAEGLEVAVGVYNGTGVNPWLPPGAATVDTSAVPAGPTPVVQDPTKPIYTTVPGKFSPQVVARLGYNNGIKGYTFSDLEGGAFRYGVGGSGMADFDYDGNGQSRLRGELDYLIKAHGFSSFGSFFIGSAQASATDWGTRRPELLAAVLQGGYVIAEFVEPAIRWAWIEQENAAGVKTTENQVSLGANLFFAGHDVKWATDFTFAPKNSSDPAVLATTDYLFRTQAQIQF